MHDKLYGTFFKPCSVQAAATSLAVLLISRLSFIMLCIVSKRLSLELFSSESGELQLKNAMAHTCMQ